MQILCQDKSREQILQSDRASNAAKNVRKGINKERENPAQRRPE
jgi:hypothetical protein